MATLKWERIEDHWPNEAEPHGYTYRAQIPGGWLVSIWAGSDTYQPHGGGLTFIPDPSHAWSATVARKTKRRTG